MASVLVAMSGGVDSSVAACLLREAGHEVLGSHLKLIHTGGVEHGCCGPQAEADARAVAEHAGFPFEVVDMSAVFEERVIADYVAEHERGRTPNPCVRCNERIKFGAFLDRARDLGMDFVATGHYARSAFEDGRWHLRRGVDRSKDQSYVLHMLGQDELAMSLFPIGEQRKEETRAHARRLGLGVAAKPDSQDLCFVPQADNGAFLEDRAPHLVREGEMVDLEGRVLGSHSGSHRYTIGQRRGLGVSTGERAYVLEVDAEANRVVVGPESLLARGGLVAERVSWVAGEPPGEPFEAGVKIRYRSEEAPAVVAPQGRSGARVEFRAPQHAVAPGQSVVFYAGDEVLGGGTIAAAIR